MSSFRNWNQRCKILPVPIPHGTAEKNSQEGMARIFQAGMKLFLIDLGS